ncbi:MULTISPECIES: MOSC N-terminal beta barrel domain-containing protein [unclassified Microcoleus]|uniref:MOSC N-terminal beta barrel domain-containing protein n=1 Tax=unclassified Microcoleus TaxID=2642155 RepID=UPI0025E1E13D|nr:MULTISPECIES: MOSC N-terminal beta barrel domain-containing protein [unclassified Microcoleus]
MTVATIKQLFTYPIKGLTPQAMSEFALTKGHGIKGDRAFALLFTDYLEGAKMPAYSASWISKKYLAVQNDWPLLAALECHYQPICDKLRKSANCQGGRLARGKIG